jgi:3',5'-cyclic AMP phosphodiesterase CpdA
MAGRAGVADRRPSGRRLYSFAVVADTHVNEREDGSMSPFATNALANGRARHVFAEFSALDPAPAFVVHLGDIVHPMPGVPAYAEAARRFRDLSAGLGVPLHLVPGNHDIGDKPVDWMPAEIVCEPFVERYRQTFGADWYAFDAGVPGHPARGIVLDAPLMNSGLPAEHEQRAWLERELAAHGGSRCFVFIHYPPFVLEPGERPSYDNIDEPARGWLLALLREHRVEALFAGHVHNFWYDLHGDTELYLLPATSFLRHDYSEFYRVDPGCEFGRGDAGKFGYAIVDVHERGHDLRLVRTGGRSLAPGERYVPRRAAAPLSVRSAPELGVGAELRHPWAEVAEITSTGGVQEFGRKRARNDYPLLALWEMGSCIAKVPEQDLLDERTLGRMRLMRAIGHRFVATVLGAPRERLLRVLSGHPGLVEALEVNLGQAALAREAPALREARAAGGVPFIWAKLRMHEDEHVSGGQINHFIRTGLLPDELDGAPAALASAGLTGVVDGLTVRIDRDVPLLPLAARVSTFAEASGLCVLAGVKLADASLARARDDLLDTARLAAEAHLAARAARGSRWIFDTLMDVDRGYFPRTAFIDRMYNPRPALRAWAAMTARLGDTRVLALAPEAMAADRPGGVRFVADGREGWLLAGSAAHARATLDAAGVSVDWTDLLAGTGIEVPEGDRGLWLVLARGRERS